MRCRLNAVALMRNVAFVSGCDCAGVEQLPLGERRSIMMRHPLITTAALFLGLSRC